MGHNRQPAIAACAPILHIDVSILVDVHGAVHELSYIEIIGCGRRAVE